MSRGSRRLAGVFLVVAALTGVPASAYDFETTIDLSYTYEQEHFEGNVDARTGFQQKYQILLETSLTSSLDFKGAVGVDLDNTWATDAASTSKISPTLDLGVEGPQSAALFSYEGTRSHTDEYQNAPDATQYSNTYDLEVELTPTVWPELKFKLQEKRDYEESTTDSSGRIIELQLRDWFYDLQWEFSLKFDHEDETLPEQKDADTTDWSWKASYKNSLYGGLDFEVAYEIQESYKENNNREVFTSLTEEYTQNLKARLKKSLLVTPRLSGTILMEYEYEQDLLEQDFDYQTQNKYAFDLRYDALSTLKITAAAKRETEMRQAVAGQDDTSKSTDTIGGAFDWEPTKWLRFGGKAEKKWEEAVDEGTGASVDRNDDEKYELIVRHRIGSVWELALGTSWAYSHTNGVLEDREAKFKAGLKLTLVDLDWLDVNFLPTYEASRSWSWDEDGFPTGDTSTSDLNIKFEARALMVDDMVEATFTHEYGQKITHETDEVLNYTRELGYNEDTRFNLALRGFVEGLDLEGEVERRADDTEDDAEPQVVEISYSVKLDYSYEDFDLSSAFKYTDKGEDPDSADFTAKIGWNGENIDVSGDYQFIKNYSDLTDESRRLNLKLSYLF